jgi:hypothetical protein
MRALLSRTAAGLTVLLALAAVAPAAACAATSGPAARPLAAGFDGGAFSGVSSVSGSGAWAVGTINGTNRTALTLAARWDGKGWSQESSPSPGGANEISQLTGVSAVSGNDAWAVGYYGTFGLETVALHWDGASWTEVATPNPGYPSSSSTLYAVSALSATDAWAVGTYGNTEQTLVAHWNGTSWALMSSPSPGGPEGSELLGVSTTSATSAWAVGCYGSSNVSLGQQTLALRWNGSTWAQTPTPEPGASGCLTSVTALSRSNAWAVGWTQASLTGLKQTLVLHWNGSRWARVASPAATTGSSELSGVSAISATDAWAAGYASGAQGDTTLIMHWNGTRWATVASPSQGSSVLTSISAVSSRNALAVGYGANGTLALHWNGTKWTIS